MDKKIFIIVLVYLALAAQGLEERNNDEKELDRLFFRFGTKKMGFKKNYKIKMTEEGVAKNLKNKGFNPKRKTKIIIHGYTHSAKSMWKIFAKAYFDAKMDVNLLIVDWRKIAKKPRYVYALDSAGKIGDRICNRVVKQVLSAGANEKNVHLVGHGLGAVVAGHAVKCLKKKVGRVTALDPAARQSAFVLSKDTARVMDVIHTNGGTLRDGCIGAPIVLGKLDFFLNVRRQYYWNEGFNNQHVPGCEDAKFSSYDELAEKYNRKKLCSHEAALKIYAESIKYPKAFEGRRCGSWTPYGKGFGISPIGRECNGPEHEQFFMGEHLDVKKAEQADAGGPLFLTITDGKSGKYSKGFHLLLP